MPLISSGFLYCSIQFEISSYRTVLLAVLRPGLISSAWV